MKKITINKHTKALIFDCDGTLVDSMALHMKACEEAFNFFNARYEFFHSKIYLEPNISDPVSRILQTLIKLLEKIQ